MENSATIEKKLRAVAGTDTRGLMIVDKSGAIVFADNAAEAFFKKKAGALAGQTLVGTLAAGEHVEVRLQAAGELMPVGLKLSEIEWSGQPHYLAALRESGHGELHYRDIVENSQDLIFLNRGGRITYVNDAGVRLLRAESVDDILGRPPLDFFHQSQHPQIRSRIADLLQGPHVAPQVEEKLVTIDGKIVEAEVRAVSFLSEGEIVIQVTCRDITERKETERALSTSIARFHQLAEAMPQIVWTSNPGGGIDYASPSFWTYTGIKSTDEAPGLRWLEAVHPEDRTAAAATRVKGQREGKPYTMEFRVKRFDGEYRWHFVNAVPVRDETGEVVKWFGSSTDIHDRKMTEKAARVLSQRLGDTLETISDAFIMLDANWDVAYMNGQAERLLQTTREAVLGKNVWEQFPNATTFREHYRRAIAQNRMVEFTEPYPPLNLWLEIRAYPSDGGIAVYFRDITERRELEARLRQSQRLEAIGQLTGGIAHDFNNLLTVIIGNAELLADKLGTDSPLQPLAELSLSAAERGAELTKRLLAFARKQALQPRAVEVNSLLTGMQALLKRTLGEHVEIELMTGGEMDKAFVDGSQLENAVLNLAINARDAMPDGGRLTIEAQNATLDETYADHHPDVTPGQYIVVAVSDSGTGMTPDVIARAFEPFFTTKEAGRGSGLGLSMVHGFVKQSGGHIKIYSEAGHGTTIKLYLPKAVAGGVDAEHHGTGEVVEGGTERVLIVEDDEQVRAHVSAQLKALGYKIVSVAGASAALEALASQTFDLLFTDVVMPGGMNGRQLADEALKKYPELKVLFTSGYTENAIVHHGRLDPGVHLLTKPYRRSDLALKVRQALKAK